MSLPLAGLWPPVATPFRDDGSIDEAALVGHSQRLLAEGAHGLAILGTTSEANSQTLEERRRAIDVHLAAGIPAERLLPGTGACALGDAVALTRHAGEIGAAGVLLLPPFYYRKASDDGLFTFVARLIDGCGASVPRVMLYHIPPIALVGWSEALVGRLVEAFPEIVVGMKDSSGDKANTLRMIAAFPGLAIFPGSEGYLLEALRAGAAGCISASANINAAGIRRLYDRWQEDDADALQAGLNAVRKAVEGRGLMPAVKAVIAARTGEAFWGNLRPPLEALPDAVRDDLLADPAIADLLAGEPA
jgi:4-hydroxy-tetrahydrodipicolinate synthase